MSYVLLHIGAGKSGSSAIQAFLDANKSQLRQHGVFVPSDLLTPDQSRNCGQQIWYFNSLLKEDQEVARVHLGDAMEDIFRAIPADQRQILIISAENLSNSIQFPSLLRILKQKCEVRIIFYIRRQDDYLISSWFQWYLKQENSFGEWIRRVAGKMANWSYILRHWETEFGQKNIVVRPYVRKFLRGGDVVEDFVAAARLPEIEYHRLKQDVNLSYDESIGYLAHAVKDLFSDIHDDRLYHMFSDLAGDAAFRSQKGSSLMTLEQRKALLKYYEEGNNRILRTYFGAEYDELFPQPSEEDVLALNPQELAQKEIAMLTRALFGIYEKLIHR